MYMGLFFINLMWAGKIDNSQVVTNVLFTKHVQHYC